MRVRESQVKVYLINALNYIGINVLRNIRIFSKPFYDKCRMTFR